MWIVPGLDTDGHVSDECFGSHGQYGSFGRLVGIQKNPTNHIQMDFTKRRENPVCNDFRMLYVCRFNLYK